MQDLPSDFLARIEQDHNRTEVLRADLEDALKEYGELDLLIELLQNALDAIDMKRYSAICQAAGQDPHDDHTVSLWNKAILDSLEADHKKYIEAENAAAKALYYQRAMDHSTQQARWWQTLAQYFGADPLALENQAKTFHGTLHIKVITNSPYWLEVEDNGVGMPNIDWCFRHKCSKKRAGVQRERRLGVRGSHGWGLTAILGLSDRVEVLSKSHGSLTQGYIFSDYASFAHGTIQVPTNRKVDVSTHEDFKSHRLAGGSDETGTLMRVRIADVSDSHVLGHSLKNYSHEKFVNLLRMYTPVGQVNDMLFHPAFHTIRKEDISITLTSADCAAIRTNVPFDAFRIAECSGVVKFGYSDYVNAGFPETTCSVHTIHRYKTGDNILLSCAEIQSADAVTRQVERTLTSAQTLPGWMDSDGNSHHEVPKGFQLALSGGMRSEYVAREPRSVSAGFRGFVLAETARPTLGRKSILDQRTAIPRAARSHENEYDDLRKKVLPRSMPPPATPAAAKWRREFFQGVIEDLKTQPPLSEDLNVWASEGSQEARTMLTFAELLAKGFFGPMKILRCHLTEKYDFAFLYSAKVGMDSAPSPNVAALRGKDLYAKYDPKSGEYYYYGIGEFKSYGHTVFIDFNPDQPRKSPNTIDLLVCSDFKTEIVEEYGWRVEEAVNHEVDFAGQTHIWRPGGEQFKRDRPLAVSSLRHLLASLEKKGVIAGPPRDWPKQLRELYL